MIDRAEQLPHFAEAVTQTEALDLRAKVGVLSAGDFIAVYFR